MGRKRGKGERMEGNRREKIKKKRKEGKWKGKDTKENEGKE